MHKEEEIKRTNIPAAILFLFLFTSTETISSPMTEAAKNGNINLIQQLLDEGYDINAVQGDGMTALHWAAENNNTKLASILIKNGADITAGTRIGQYKPLHIAARKGNTNIIDILLESGSDPNSKTLNSGATPLHLAAAANDSNGILSLIKHGANINAVEEKWNQTPLMFAAALNRLNALRTLLEAGADPSITSKVIDVAEMEKADKEAEKNINNTLKEFKDKDDGGVDWQPTPSQVQTALKSGRKIQLQGVDENTKQSATNDVKEDEAIGQFDSLAVVTYNSDGEPVYEYNNKAEENEEQVRQSYGQMVGQWGGLTALLHAARQGHMETALALIENNANINQASAGDNTTPLLIASINGQFDLAKKFIVLGANPNIASKAGTTPLFAVLERNWAPKASYAHPIEHRHQNTTHLELLKALLDADADPNVRLKQHLWYTEYTFSLMSVGGIHYRGATPFWRAAQALDIEAMQLLAKYSADPNIPNTKRPKRRRSNDQGMKKDKDASGLNPIPIGGPSIFPIHLASGAGYGQHFVGNAHRHAPNNWLPTVKYLVESLGADVNLRDANGYTPLHHAASRGDNEMILYLIEQGADIMVLSRSGQTIVDMANGPIQRVPPFRETIDLLVNLGAKNNNNCVSC